MRKVVDFDQSPSFLVAVLTNRMQLQAGRELRDVANVSLTEFAVIAMAATEPGAPPQRVIDVSALDKSVVSRAIKALELRGLISVEPHPSHRRKTALHLTKAGDEVHDICLALSVEGDARMLAGMDDATVRKTKALLHHMLAQYEN